jgi:hypothetical protein
MINESDVLARLRRWHGRAVNPRELTQPGEDPSALTAIIDRLTARGMLERVSAERVRLTRHMVAP